MKRINVITLVACPHVWVQATKMRVITMLSQNLGWCCTIAGKGYQKAVAIAYTIAIVHTLSVELSQLISSWCSCYCSLDRG